MACTSMHLQIYNYKFESLEFSYKIRAIICTACNGVVHANILEIHLLAL